MGQAQGKPMSTFLPRVLLLLAAQSCLAAGTQPVPIEVTPYWNKVASGDLSPDGRWASYLLGPATMARGQRQRTLHLKELDGDKLYAIPGGNGSNLFSDDGRWAGYTLPTGRFELLELASGRRTQFADVQRSEFGEGSRWLVLTSPKQKLTVRDLRTGQERALTDVAQYAFDRTARQLLYRVDAAGETADGVHVLDLATSDTRALASGPGTYGEFSWNATAARLVVAHSAAATQGATPTRKILAWRDVGSASEQRIEWAPHASQGFPTGYELDDGVPVWTGDGERMVVTIRKIASSSTRVAEPAPKVEVRHWVGNARPRSTLSGVVHLDSARFVQVELEPTRAVGTGTPDVQITADARWAVLYDDSPYRRDFSARRPFDAYRLDTQTGERTLIEKRLLRSGELSPNSKSFVYLGPDRQLYAFDLPTGQRRALAQPPGLEFADPVYFMPGSLSWTSDGGAALFAGHYVTPPNDIWKLPLDGGAAVNLTRGIGEAQQIRFSLPALWGKGVDLSGPIILYAHGLRTKKSGFWRLEPGRAPRPLLWEDRLVGYDNGLRVNGMFQQAKGADRILFSRETFREYPDYWVATTAFERLRRVTDANPAFLKDYAWGRNILIDYTTAAGTQLQGILTLPAGYEPGKRYPMVVSQYQMLSQNYHNFRLPYEHIGVWPMPSTYASHGYLVLQPDIPEGLEEDENRPGDLALDAVTAAVNKAVELGYADPGRVGLHGQSFGGYHALFIATQTKIFAAAVATAGIADLVSTAYGSLYRPWDVEEMQFQLKKSLWEAPELWRSQSPIQQVTKLETPMLLYAGQQDDTVPWTQGIEFFNAARRNGKPVTLLVYPDEEHGILKRENQDDFQARMKAFYDHYLMGKPAPDWMAEALDLQ
jgi:dipeptidyl aminopeptidase/acylaminoacyl peptidase